MKRAAREFNIDIKKSLFIGDNPSTDGEVARRLGMKCVILKRRHRKELSKSIPKPLGAST